MLAVQQGVSVAAVNVFKRVAVRMEDKIGKVLCAGEAEETAQRQNILHVAFAARGYL